MLFAEKTEKRSKSTPIYVTCIRKQTMDLLTYTPITILSSMRLCCVHFWALDTGGLIYAIRTN